MTRQSSQQSVASRQERAAGRILDDEGLRGDLDDDEYQPLLDWALAETDRVAASTESMSDVEAEAIIDTKLQVIRDVVRAASAAIVAHNEVDAKRRSSELAVIGTEWNRKRQFEALAHRLDAETDLSGAQVATHIVEALGTTADTPASGAKQERET